MARDAHANLRAKRQRAMDLAANSTSGTPRLGMVRHLYVVLDYSSAMMERDLFPTRIICTIRVHLLLVQSSLTLIGRVIHEVKFDWIMPSSIRLLEGVIFD